MVVLPTLDEALDWYLFGGEYFDDVTSGPQRWDGILADGHRHVFDQDYLGAPREQIRARILRRCLARGRSVSVGYRRVDGEPALEVRGVEVLWVIG